MMEEARFTVGDIRVAGRHSLKLRIIALFEIGNHEGGERPGRHLERTELISPDVKYRR